MIELIRRPIKKLTRDELERELCGLQEYCDNAMAIDNYEKMRLDRLSEEADRRGLRMKVKRIYSLAEHD